MPRLAAKNPPQFRKKFFGKNPAWGRAVLLHCGPETARRAQAGKIVKVKPFRFTLL
jgi:hypothetical protein